MTERNLKQRTPTDAATAKVDQFLAKVKSTPKSGAPGRLCFAMDATASRQPSWDRAVAVQGQMFLEAAKRGGLKVQLVFFRGFGECKSSKWVDRPQALITLMSKVMCRAGQTQIERILNHALREAEKAPLAALVYVGDCCEESVDRLGHVAGKLGVRGTRVFLFQEGNDPTASFAFGQIAQLTGGAHCQLSDNSPDQLRELLGAVAAYAAGGVQALTDVNQRQRHQLRLADRR